MCQVVFQDYFELTVFIGTDLTPQEQFRTVNALDFMSGANILEATVSAYVA
jgi:hypothetical protein